MAFKGSARYTLFGSIIVENTIIESQSRVTVDLKWSHVENILETPPLSSTATLVQQPLTQIWSTSVIICKKPNKKQLFSFAHIQNIKVASGDRRSPVFETYRELEFLQVCVSHQSGCEIIN